jgi:hypothetical protein
MSFEVGQAVYLVVWCKDGTARLNRGKVTKVTPRTFDVDGVRAVHGWKSRPSSAIRNAYKGVFIDASPFGLGQPTHETDEAVKDILALRRLEAQMRKAGMIK